LTRFLKGLNKIHNTIEMDYIEISIRITLPSEITEVIRREKERFVSVYGSKYKSTPHITLYLARYTTDGVAKLATDLRGFTFKAFSFELLAPKMIPKGDRNAYVVDMSNKREIEELHAQIASIASRYESPLLRDADQRRVREGGTKESGSWYPHVTLGTISANAPQSNSIEIEQNLHDVMGIQINVSDITIFVYGRSNDEEKVRLIEEITVPLRP